MITVRAASCEGERLVGQETKTGIFIFSNLLDCMGENRSNLLKQSPHNVATIYAERQQLRMVRDFRTAMIKISLLAEGGLYGVLAFVVSSGGLDELSLCCVASA